MGEISGGSDEKVDVSTDDKISAYESLLMDCKEAIEVNSFSFKPKKIIEDFLIFPEWPKRFLQSYPFNF